MTSIFEDGTNFKIGDTKLATFHKGYEIAGPVSNGLKSITDGDTVRYFVVDPNRPINDIQVLVIEKNNA